LTRKKLVDVDTVTTAMASPESFARAQEVADKAVTLLRNEGNIVPLPRLAQNCLIVVNSLRHSIQGQRLLREFRKRSPNDREVVVDTGMPYASLEAAVEPTSSCSSIVVASFASMTARTENVDRLIEKLTQGAVPVVIATFNDPYIGGRFPKAVAYLTPFSSVPPAEIAVAKALFGEIGISGHTPVTIPEVAPLGAGISVPTRAQLAGR
jgi:beta-N-acetylhexosaminidase